MILESRGQAACFLWKPTWHFVQDGQPADEKTVYIVYFEYDIKIPDKFILQLNAINDDTGAPLSSGIKIAELPVSDLSSEWKLDMALALYSNRDVNIVHKIRDITI